MHQTVGDWCSGSTPDFDSVSISSILISPARNAVVALVVERILGKDEVVSSNLINSTREGELVWSFQHMPEEHGNQVRFLDLPPRNGILGVMVAPRFVEPVARDRYS